MEDSGIQAKQALLSQALKNTDIAFFEELLES